jgi:hypothetical protein
MHGECAYPPEPKPTRSSGGRQRTLPLMQHCYSATSVSKTTGMPAKRAAAAAAAVADRKDLLPFRQNASCLSRRRRRRRRRGKGPCTTARLADKSCICQMQESNLFALALRKAVAKQVRSQFFRRNRANAGSGKNGRSLKIIDLCHSKKLCCFLSLLRGEHHLSELADAFCNDAHGVWLNNMCSVSLELSHLFSSRFCQRSELKTLDSMITIPRTDHCLNCLGTLNFIFGRPTTVFYGRC